MKGGILINFIIATHGHMALGTKNTLEIISQKNDVYVMSAYVDNDDLEAEVKKPSLCLQTRGSQKTLIFTDLLAGSVNQRITKEFLNDHTFIIAGYNLAVLLECIMLNDEQISITVLNEIVERGKNEIVLVNSLFNDTKGENTC